MLIYVNCMFNLHFRTEVLTTKHMIIQQEIQQYLSHSWMWNTHQSKTCSEKKLQGTHYSGPTTLNTFTLNNIEATRLVDIWAKGMPDLVLICHQLNTFCGGGKKTGVTESVGSFVTLMRDSITSEISNDTGPC